MRGNPVGFYGAFVWIVGQTPCLWVRAHSNCALFLKTRVLARNLVPLVLVTLIVVVGITQGWNKWPTIGLAIAVMTLPVIWQVVRPVAFEFVRRGDVYVCMFAERSYAEEFAALNNGEIEEID
jgi:hypothetical protein